MPITFCNLLTDVSATTASDRPPKSCRIQKRYPIWLRWNVRLTYKWVTLLKVVTGEYGKHGGEYIGCRIIDPCRLSNALCMARDRIHMEMMSMWCRTGTKSAGGRLKIWSQLPAPLPVGDCSLAGYIWCFVTRQEETPTPTRVCHILATSLLRVASMHTSPPLHTPYAVVASVGTGRLP